MSADLLTLNVNEHTEKKGNLTYLSWAWAWAEVLKHDPGATWRVHMYGPMGAEQPCMWIGETAMVHTTVTVKGLARECLLPVMDHKNNAMKNPDARKISDAIMRCMTKAISMHGLGLYIYAGEDVPQGDSDEPAAPAAKPLPHTPSVAKTVLNDMPPLDAQAATYYKELAAEAEDAFTKQGQSGAYDYVQAFALDNEQMMYLWANLDSKIRSALKAEKTRRTAKEPA